MLVLTLCKNIWLRTIYEDEPACVILTLLNITTLMTNSHDNSQFFAQQTDLNVVLRLFDLTLPHRSLLVLTKVNIYVLWTMALLWCNSSHINFPIYFSCCHSTSWTTWVTSLDFLVSSLLHSSVVPSGE